MLCFDAIPKPVTALLTILTARDELAGFSLGDGTSLALRFGHRWSVDLDFFTAKEFYPETLFENLKLANATVIGRGKNSLTVEVAGVKLDLLRHAYPSLAASELIDGIDLISLPDLAAMKLNAISNRGSKKDFLDIAELLKSFTLPQMIGFFSEKYPLTDSFTVIRSLAWFEDAETEPDPISLNGSSWNQVKLRVSLAVAEL